MPKRRTDERTPEKRKADWLDAFERCGTVIAACRDAKVPRTCVYEWRQADEDFALAWADIEELTTERMEQEAYRRAVEGVRKDIFYRDTVIGEERSYSDTLLIFMLKARRPEKYRENVKVEHTGSVGLDVTAMSDEELRAIADGITAKRG